VLNVNRVAGKCCQRTLSGAVNAFTVPTILRLLTAQTVDLQSLKQLLCQPGNQGDKNRKKLKKTEGYKVSIRDFRNEDMSNKCRHLRTRIMTEGLKLLIANGGATVAEARQGDDERQCEAAAIWWRHGARQALRARVRCRTFETLHPCVCLP
jgi:hypothetical protein